MSNQIIQKFTLCISITLAFVFLNFRLLVHDLRTCYRVKNNASDQNVRSNLLYRYDINNYYQKKHKVNSQTHRSLRYPVVFILIGDGPYW